MSVDPRPQENVQWAEEGPPQRENSNLPEEPDPETKADGYGYRQLIPHENFNWLHRALGRWVSWLTSKIDNHVHDGEQNPESAPKVDLQDHIDYQAGSGTGHGFLKVDRDDQFFHEINYNHEDAIGKSVFRVDRLIARDEVETTRIGHPTADRVEVNDLDDDSPGQIGIGAKNTLKGLGYYTLGSSGAELLGGSPAGYRMAEEASTHTVTIGGEPYNGYLFEHLGNTPAQTAINVTYDANLDGPVSVTPILKRVEGDNNQFFVGFYDTIAQEAVIGKGRCTISLMYIT